MNSSSQPNSSSDLFEPKFPPGRLAATTGALLNVPIDEIAEAILRHLSGDWGDLDPEDKAENDRALQDGRRLLSAYQTASGIKFWIVTEWNRSFTTVLLPDEY